MASWAMNQHWWRYLYTLDAEWLRSTGYPMIRDCALFYTDFLQKGEDGLYHAFLSNQGEDGFTDDAKDYTDRAQVMQRVRYCLCSAISASEVLNEDRPGVANQLRDSERTRAAYFAQDGRFGSNSSGRLGCSQRTGLIRGCCSCGYVSQDF